MRSLFLHPLQACSGKEEEEEEGQEEELMFRSGCRHDVGWDLLVLLVYKRVIRGEPLTTVEHVHSLKPLNLN